MEILWRPDERFIASSAMWRYVQWLRELYGVDVELSTEAEKNVELYNRLWRWSVENIEAFWLSIWRFYRVSARSPFGRVLEGSMPGARWFVGARLNYAEHVFKAARWGEPAVVYVREDGVRRVLTWDTLARQAASLASWLREAGVGKGDVVAAYVSAVPEAVAALLATASIGAVWAAVGAELAPKAAAERLGQLRPKVLIATDGYLYRGRAFGRSQDIPQIASAVGAQKVITIPSLRPTAEAGTDWNEAAGRRGIGLEFEAMEFNEPLWVLFTSGTTGIPKPVVHGHGGILLEAYKVGLHMDYRPGEVFTWYTTPSWMMWNYVVNGLLHGVTVLFYDGDPTARNYAPFWELVEREGISILGLSAPYIHGAMKSGIEPSSYNLKALRQIGSTAAPLSPQGFDWVYRRVKEDVWLNPISGGTDVCSAFVGGCPVLPVWRGEMSCRWLGAAVNVYGEDGRPVTGEVGELVLERPMPSMPVYFWNDHDYSWYRRSYFDMFPGVWRHGDWAVLTGRGSIIISGRSDSTIKRKGVRIGTLDIYKVVESIPEVAGSLAIGLEDQLVLLVALKPGAELTEDLKRRINEELRRQLGPYFVADHILQVPDIPMTRNYKKLEVPLKKILAGTPPEKAVNINAVLNPEALYAAVEALRRLRGSA